MASLAPYFCSRWSWSTTQNFNVCIECNLSVGEDILFSNAQCINCHTKVVPQNFFQPLLHSFTALLILPTPQGAEGIIIHKIPFLSDGSEAGDNNNHNNRELIECFQGLKPFNSIKKKYFKMQCANICIQISSIKICYRTYLFTQKSETRMIASILKQDPNIWKVQKNAIY